MTKHTPAVPGVETRRVEERLADNQDSLFWLGITFSLALVSEFSEPFDLSSIT